MVREGADDEAELAREVELGENVIDMMRAREALDAADEAELARLDQAVADAAEYERAMSEAVLCRLG